MAQAGSRSNRQEKADFPGLNVPSRPASDVEPVSLTNVLTNLFHVRGYGRKRADQQLHELWSQAAGPEIASQTKATSLRGGVLHVAVFNPVQLQELNGFHREELLRKLREESPTAIRDLKFRLQSRR